MLHFPFVCLSVPDFHAQIYGERFSEKDQINKKTLQNNILPLAHSLDELLHICSYSRSLEQQ